MKGWLFIHGLVAVIGVSTIGCRELIRGDKDYVLDDGSDAGAGGSGGGASGGAGSGGESGSTGEGAGGAPALACDSGWTRCNESCVVLASDAAHCGWCGHDCLGGDCQSGLCGAVVVATALPVPQDLAVDASHAYWTAAGGAVQRAPKGGGEVETVAADQGVPGAIAVDDKHVFWANQETGRVMSWKKSNGKLKSLFKGDGLKSLTLDADNLYFARKLKKGDIRRLSKKAADDGMEGMPSVTLATDQDGATDVRLFGTQVFWTGHIDSGSGDQAPPGGYIRMVPRQGGPLETIVSGEGEIANLAAVGERAVWFDATNKRLRMRAFAGGEIATLAESEDVHDLAPDGGSVVWSTAGGTVKSQPVPQGMARLLAVGVVGAGAVAVDDKYVYFIRNESGGSTLLRVAK